MPQQCHVTPERGTAALPLLAMTPPPARVGTCPGFPAVQEQAVKGPGTRSHEFAS